MKKIRLDQLLLELNLAPSLEKARAYIGAGQVLVNDEPADKAGMTYPCQSAVRLRKKCPYVSRGGFKLEQALNYFSIDLAGKVCADIGASSGGFTDCLLQHDVGKVFAVDVAYGQLDWKIRQDDRVVVLERFNARNLLPESLGEEINLAVMDTSFISITKLIPALLPLFAKGCVDIIALIKPQFELPKGLIGNGVVRDPALHQQAIDKIKDFVAELGLQTAGITPSPILGPKGNREFLLRILS
ncbi:TlyA family RNA methyltransferase [Desulfotalea psychrophila]|uniref:Related to hemolysin A n=1 Tax=Desulfotalea psychrophila (strain LSv54 / DSM 12343) TaxID=177439 RepID=Q6AKI2_DESPS|nr:TlyA family RNA methyltransferase [Desulfotalea psychrophila]CAG37143.1 related to hemolysin A [Desulfotalea psychrophila LSv54]